MSSSPQNPNANLMLAALERLVPLLDRIAFVGGCATALFITDPASAPVRPTLDVDAIVEISSYLEFTKLESELRLLGWHELREEGAPLCRWTQNKLIVDLMPTDPAILGFSNRWYRPVFENAAKANLGDYEFRLITAPYFLATKLEAFRGRGKGDDHASHDLEDIVTVVDGRAEIVAKVAHSDDELRQYLSQQFSLLLDNRDFLEALPGHLLPDAASQQRIPILLDRLRRIAES